MKKRILGMLIAIVLLISISASCKKEQENDNGDSTETTTGQDTTTISIDARQGQTNETILRTMYTRLSSGTLDSLTPSNNYGMLLPYTGGYEISGTGDFQTAKYGLVTVEGMIVTDPVYDSAFRAQYYSLYDEVLMPAYLLGINRYDGETILFGEKDYAVCALDGSWITPFGYDGVWFTSNAIIMHRDYETSDIDVYDYDGRLLYNMKNLDWVADLDTSSPYGLSIRGGTDDYMRAHMIGGTVAVIDIMTGNCMRTEYLSIDTFSDGLAAVTVQDFATGEQLVGFINTEFEMVIEPQYRYAHWFFNEYSVAFSRNQAVYLIDKEGKEILSVDDGYIEQNFDGFGFILYDYETGINRYYTSNFVPISMVSQYGHYENTRYVGEGWYFSECYDNVMRPSNGVAETEEYSYIGKVLHRAGEEHLFTDIWSISQVIGDYVVYMCEMEYTGESVGNPQISAQGGIDYFTGVMTISGVEIVSPERGTLISVVVEDGEVIAFIENTATASFNIGGTGLIDADTGFRIFGTDGRIIAQGPGMAAYERIAGVYSVLAEDIFCYLDIDGNVIIGIPLN